MDNLVVSKKSSLKNCGCNISPNNKKQNRKCSCGVITKKYKDFKKTKSKVRKVARNSNLLNEWAENESSIGEICEASVINQIKKNPSNESVIYVGGFPSVHKHFNKLPIVDLTNSSSEDITSKQTLKTIYFPSRNFDRNFRVRKTLATTSLMTLPVIKKQTLPRKLNSTSFLHCKHKLSVLDLPDQYLDVSDLSCTDISLFDKANLTQSDYKMIDWILEREQQADSCVSQSTSGYESSLDTGLSIDNMMRVYKVTSKDTF